MCKAYLSFELWKMYYINDKVTIMDYPPGHVTDTHPSPVHLALELKLLHCPVGSSVPVQYSQQLMASVGDTAQRSTTHSVTTVWISLVEAIMEI